jgi:hypothetical protein
MYEYKLLSCEIVRYKTTLFQVGLLSLSNVQVEKKAVINICS